MQYYLETEEELDDFKLPMNSSVKRFFGGVKF